MSKVTLSSTCFPQRNLNELCDFACENEFKSVELSGNLKSLPIQEVRHIISTYQERIKFYIHNYFPAPENPFVLNLAHPETVERSLVHSKKAIDLCADLGIKQYSIHAGLAFNPRPTDLGNNQSHLLPINLGESRQLLMKASREIADYAQSRNVRFLLENNVAAKFNIQDGKNNRYHLTDIWESRELEPLFDHPNIGILLDVGHLKVSANIIGFDPIDFVDNFFEKIFAVHLSENDGFTDQNKPLMENSWFWSHIPWDNLDYVSLEISKKYIDQLKEQFNLTQKIIEIHTIKKG